MLEKTFDRRWFLEGSASLAILTSLPALAKTLPTVDEVAFDPAIPALGNPEGDVTIVEFVDYQCPYCKLCYRELAKLLSEDTNIRLVMKDWPIFGDASLYTARMVLAAAGGAHYGPAVDAFMDNEQRLSKRRVDAILGDVGIDVRRLRDSLATRQSDIDLLLARNAAQATAFSLAGTPALLIGGVLYRHGLPLADLRNAVAKARAADSAADPA